ncbi:MAG TPA: branched-chain amino acid ABC transporter permease [Candidatus Dormibacteraeota bacterium]|jgi:branched-chain amino acid transport system permease protein|nr:branched-chain amino acid ABC transporter permease [Candidatus Dormibacteraeota bacterium]
MDAVLVAALNGLVVGASIALVAAGLALLFGVLGILNFAQGDFFMLGTYAVWLALAHGLSFWLGVVASVVVIGLVGGLGLMAMLWPLRDRAHALVLLATLALSLIIEQLVTNVFGASSRTVPAPIEARIPIGDTNYPVYDLVVVGAAAVILAGGFVFLKYLKYGIWLRAVAENRRMAGILGVPVLRVYALAFVVSAGLAAVAGSLLAPLVSVYPTVGLDTNLNAFIVVIAGGLGNFRGAALIALGLGVVESLGSIWIRGEAVEILVFALVILLLILRARRQLVLVRL